MHQKKTHNCARLLSGLSGQPSPCVVGETGNRASGEGEQAAGLQRDEGFHSNLSLPIAKIALQFPRLHSCGPLS